MYSCITIISHCRADREKGILQGKLRMVQKNIIESMGRPQLVSSAGKEATPTTTTTSADGAGLGGEERHQLKSRIYHLENQVHVHVHNYRLMYGHVHVHVCAHVHVVAR